MAKKVLKWVGIGLGVLIVLVIATGAYLYYQGGRTFRKVYPVPNDNITIPTGADAVEKGRHVAITRECTECHLDDFRGGRVFINDNMLGTFASANVTSGKGGVGGKFKDKDWINAIRYGVNPKGQSLVIMPSEVYYYLNDEDLGYLIAYLKALPPVDNTPPDRRIGPMGRLIIARGQFPLTAELVQKLPPRPAAVQPGPTAEYGHYLASTVCTNCHGPNLAGEYFPPGQPNAKLTPNLTPAGEMLVWSQDDFIKAMRTGVKPGGSLDPAQMPWKELGQMTDDELAAIYVYLKSLPKTQPPAKQ